MSALLELEREARRLRDAEIEAARARYRRTVRSIRDLGRELGQRPPGRYQVKPRKLVKVSDELVGLTLTKAARTVLEKLGPLTLTELVVEVQNRGCRTGDDPRAIRHALRVGLKRNSRGWFERVGEKWGLTLP